LRALIEEVEGLSSVVRKDIEKESKETVRLQKVIDTPEENPHGPLSKEAESLKKENEVLRKRQDKQSIELIQHRDERNKLIEDHRELVLQYN